jgi:hypothetical protein
VRQKIGGSVEEAGFEQCIGMLESPDDGVFIILHVYEDETWASPFATVRLPTFNIGNGGVRAGLLVAKDVISIFG